MRLHLCCGTVYLWEYLNVDIQGTIIDEVQPDVTTFDHYYKYPLENEPKTDRGKFIVDSKQDLLKSWPWGSDSIEKVVMIQAIEHFVPDEAEFIISEVHRVLRPRGIFYFDFPDIVKTVFEYAASNFKMMSRLIYCNHLDTYSIHKCAYNERAFSELLFNNSREWAKVTYKEIVKHDYPVIGGFARK